MSLKRKIAIRISIVFSILFAVVMVVIYFSFSDFRRDEFENRFKQRLVFTVRFIEQSKDFDEEAPVFFNENSDNVLLNEQILIFNEEKKLIYSTVKDDVIHWDDHLLEDLDANNTIYKEGGSPDIYAALRKINRRNYYILTSAQDITGVAKLNYLKYLLLFSFLITGLSIGFLSYYFMGKYLLPLEVLNTKIKDITSSHELSPIHFTDSGDEIAALTKSFNIMLSRLNVVFEAQKGFTASASHEIRTPLARMAFQLENLSHEKSVSHEDRLRVDKILQEVYQLSDLTQSLLLLAKMEDQNNVNAFEEVRVDEVIFDAYQKVKSNFPELEMNFLIVENVQMDYTFSIMGNKSLLEIVLINLLKNAALYSDQPKVDVLVDETETGLRIDVDSKGSAITKEKQEKMFQPFSRGENVQNVPGSGLGLVIVKRIMDFHKGKVAYCNPMKGTNRFTLLFGK